MLTKEEAIIIHDILQRYRFIQKAWIFGSYAKNKEKPDSELDIMFDKLPGSRYGLIKFSSLIIEIEDALGKKVNLIERKNMPGKARRNADKDQMLIYDRVFEADVARVQIILKEMAKSRSIKIKDLRLLNSHAFYPFMVYMLRGCKIKAEFNGTANYSDDDHQVIIGFARTIALLRLSQQQEIEDYIEHSETQVFLHEFIDTYSRIHMKEIRNEYA